MNAELLARAGVEEEGIAVDSTGLAPTQASAHYRSRSGRDYWHYVKALYAVGTTSQFILAWRFDWGPIGSGSTACGGVPIAMANRPPMDMPATSSSPIKALMAKMRDPPTSFPRAPDTNGFDARIARCERYGWIKLA